MKKIVVFGCGENGLQAWSCLRHDATVSVVGFLDDDAGLRGSSYLELPVFGGGDLVPELRSVHGVEAVVVAIGNGAVRKRVTTEMRERGLRIASAIHPTVLVESPKRIGEGVILEMGSAVHPEAEIGDGVFLGGGAIVSHHSVVGEFSLIAGGVVFGGRVTIGEQTLIGVGASIKPHVRIGSHVIVGVGAAVISDLPNGAVAVGVPARIIGSRAS